MRMRMLIKILCAFLIITINSYADPLYKAVQEVDSFARVPESIGEIVDGIEYVDFNQIDPLLKYATFNEIAQEQFEKDKTFVLAVVATLPTPNSKSYVHHFYWHESLQSFFDSLQGGLYYINPYNGQRITGIQYFALKNNEDKFEFLGSRKDDLINSYNYNYYSNDEDDDDNLAVINLFAEIQ